MTEHALQYREIAPPGVLADFVRCIWRLHGDPGRDHGGPPDPIIPDGCAEIVVNVGDPFIRHGPEGSSERQPLRLIAGQITRALTLGPSGQIDIWGIRFHPWCAASFLGVSASELRDQVVSLDAVTRALHDAFESVADQRTESTAEQSVIDALTRRARNVKRPDSHVPRLVALASASSETTSVSRLAREAGVSTRRIQMLFRDHVGLSPKQLLRVTRFQRALRLARTRPTLSWGHIAQLAGFYDQAHLIHDSNDIAGYTPKELVRRDAPLTEVFLDGGAV
jgi:AraC-like DNA-binding protein